MSSGHVCIIAHFHDVGEVTFESDDTSTAQEKYNQYISEHPLKERSATEIGDFTVYHAEIPAGYDMCNARSWRWMNTENPEWGVYIYTHMCSSCGYVLTGQNIPGDYDYPHAKPGSYHAAQPAYYTPSCGYADGEVLRVEVIF